MSARRLGLVALLAVLAVPGAPPAHASNRARAATARSFTLYGVVTRKLFINNVDDLARGQGQNPFGNFSSVPPPKNERTSGPFAGDEGVYAFDLYRKKDLKSKAGSAVLVCWYGFNQSALCDASYRLDGGSLVGKGTLDFNDPRSAIGIVGGASKYRDATGLVRVSALGVATQSQPVRRAAPVLQKQRLDFTLGPAASTAATPQRLTTYSDPTHEAYVANADDQTRGAVSNPFGVHLSRAAAGLTATKGPYAGDEALFAFDVYADPGFTRKIGSAVYTCQYSFDRDAFCDASFELDGGTLIAAGVLNFDSRRFELAVTGGYGRYGGVTGDVEASPSGKYGHRLSFTLG